jgi:hypothetical protein
MRVALTAVLLVFLTQIETAQSGTRPWPDTTAGIGVFADQLPSSLTEAQRRFAALHLVGTQKQLASNLRAIRAYNPYFLCIHYQLGVGCGPALFCDGLSWTSDWSYVSNQASWFLLNSATQRVHQTTWDWYVMDIRYTNGVPVSGFPAYWISNALSRIRSSESDGVFADSFTQDAYTFGQCNPSHAWLDDVNACKANWIPQLMNFGQAITNAFVRDGAGFLFLPNLGGLLTSWDTTDFGIGDGGMIEGFCFWSSGNYFAVSDWKLQADRILNLGVRNKVLICQTYISGAPVSDRLFVMCSYLLIKARRTYINMAATGNLEFYPEYKVQLGRPRQVTAPSMDSLWSSAWGVYRRDFTNGLVLVNPSAAPVNVSALGATYYNVTPAGGGDVDTSGNASGTLAFSPVSSVSIPAHSGVILLVSTNYPADTDGDGMPDDWEVEHGLNPSSPADAAIDSDGDRASNLAEFLAGTIPEDGNSVFRITDFSPTGITWNTVEGRNYRVERSVDLTGAWQLLDIVPSWTNFASMRLTATTNSFYRIRTSR